MHNHKQLNNSKSEEAIPKKRQWFDKCDNDKKLNLNKNESKFEGNRYIPLFVYTLFPLTQKESNRRQIWATE